MPQIRVRGSVDGLRGSVGVAPGSYTLQLGAPAEPACVTDVNGPFGYGLPARGWYDEPSTWYTSQFTTAVAPATATDGCCQQPVALDPYGTDSQLKGLGDATTTIFGIAMLVELAGLGLGIFAGYKIGKKSNHPGWGGVIGGLAGTMVGGIVGTMIASSAPLPTTSPWGPVTQSGSPDSWNSSIIW